MDGQMDATWARLSDGSWGVRARVGEIGETVTVRRKDGSSSQVVLGTQDGGPELYHVGSQVRAEARVIGGTRRCACGRAIDGDYQSCYRCSPAGRTATAALRSPDARCGACGVRAGGRGRGFPRLYSRGGEIVCGDCYRDEEDG